jgi:hypothetical protein
MLGEALLMLSQHIGTAFSAVNSLFQWLIRYLSAAPAPLPIQAALHFQNWPVGSTLQI